MGLIVRLHYRVSPRHRVAKLAAKINCAQSRFKASIESIQILAI